MPKIELMLKKRLSDAWSILATVSLTLLLNAPAFGQGVIIHLKNGDRISGTILSETPSSVRLTNSFLGAFEVPIAEISKREVQAAPSRCHGHECTGCRRRHEYRSGKNECGCGRSTKGAETATQPGKS